MCLTIGIIVVSNTSREADDTSIALCNPRISPKILIFNVFQIYFCAIKQQASFRFNNL